MITFSVIAIVLYLMYLGMRAYWRAVVKEKEEMPYQRKAELEARGYQIAVRIWSSRAGGLVMAALIYHKARGIGYSRSKSRSEARTLYRERKFWAQQAVKK